LGAVVLRVTQTTLWFLDDLPWFEKIKVGLCDHLISQTVSCRLPTAAGRGRARVWSCGICGGQSVARTGFLIVLRFPLPIFIPPISP
jgi:hypothetical protein